MLVQRILVLIIRQIIQDDPIKSFRNNKFHFIYLEIQFALQSFHDISKLLNTPVIMRVSRFSKKLHNSK